MNLASEPGEAARAVAKDLDPFGADIAVPVFADEKLSHVILLGPKRSGEGYTHITTFGCSRPWPTRPPWR